MVATVEPLIRKLELLGPLSDEERAALRAAPLRPLRVLPGRDLIRAGSPPSDCALLLDGMAFRYKLVPGGGRQILSFHFPGDLLDLTSLLLDQVDHGVGVPAPAEVAMIPQATVLDWMERLPRLRLALWRDTQVDSAIFREWVVNVGRRNAQQRVAHVLCETVSRLRRLGLAEGDSCDLPITQSELADATGLSQVHVNRTLQALRGQGLIRWTGQRLVTLEWEGLVRLAGFETDYLHRLADAA